MNVVIDHNPAGAPSRSLPAASRDAGIAPRSVESPEPPPMRALPRRTGTPFAEQARRVATA